jgi:hypothetical protein
MSDMVFHYIVVLNTGQFENLAINIMTWEAVSCAINNIRHADAALYVLSNKSLMMETFTFNNCISVADIVQARWLHEQYGSLNGRNSWI